MRRGVLVGMANFQGFRVLIACPPAAVGRKMIREQAPKKGGGLERSLWLLASDLPPLFPCQ
jgi:hypothetical protein